MALAVTGPGHAYLDVLFPDLVELGAVTGGCIKVEGHRGLAAPAGRGQGKEVELGVAGRVEALAGHHGLAFLDVETSQGGAEEVGQARHRVALAEPSRPSTVDSASSSNPTRHAAPLPREHGGAP